VARADGRPFAFESVTYHPEGTASGVGYLTLFPIGRVMRANLSGGAPRSTSRCGGGSIGPASTRR
jgi:hypothetical protein